MQKNNEAPKYINVKRTVYHQKAEIIEQIKELYRKQSFGVLTPQGKTDAYTSLISFVVTDGFFLQSARVIFNCV